MATKKTAETPAEPVIAEQVVQIPLTELHPFEGHPFKVLDDELMQDTVDSIMQFGVLTPAIVRPDPGGGYEMVAGHRRLRASKIAGKETMPVIVRNMTDDEAIILMVDSNLQRENILPSERAFAYRMKLEALKHQGQRTITAEEPTSPQVGEKSSWAVSLVANDANTSRSQIQRYIRLTELNPQLLEMVDTKQLAFNPAVELSYLKPAEQQAFIDAMDYAQATPSLSQAQRLKKLSQDGKCTSEAMCAVMSEEKKSELDHLTLRNDVLSKYFPKSYTPQKMQETIIKLLEQWQKKRQRDNER